VLRYVERNALRANLRERAEGWKDGSLVRRTSGTEDSRELLSEWGSARNEVRGIEMADAGRVVLCVWC